jgi:hypothetical protein
MTLPTSLIRLLGNKRIRKPFGVFEDLFLSNSRACLMETLRKGAKPPSEFFMAHW